MEICVRIVKQDCADDLKHFYFRRYFFQSKVLYLLFGAFFLCNLIFYQSFSVEEYLVVLIGFTVIAGVVYAYDYEVKLKEVIASFLRDESGIRVINYVLKTDGIVVECGKETMLFKWGEVISVDVNPYGVYVILSNQTALMLPERFFRYNQKEEFLDEVDRQVFNVRKRAPLPLVKAKDSVKLPKKNPSLFFYAFTLLSFIPLLGFFIGAVVVMFGVWDYRN